MTVRSANLGELVAALCSGCVVATRLTTRSAMQPRRSIPRSPMPTYCPKGSRIDTRRGRSPDWGPSGSSSA